LSKETAVLLHKIQHLGELGIIISRTRTNRRTRTNWAITSQTYINWGNPCWTCFN